MTDFKALKLAKAAKLLSDLAYAAVDHRLSDTSCLNRAIVDAGKVMDDYMGQFSDEASVEPSRSGARRLGNSQSIDEPPIL
jgi:hypothetical protein